MFPRIAAIWIVGRAPGWGWKKTCRRAKNCWFASGPFLEHLAASSLSPKTIRMHVDNLWMLGGEIIRHLHYDPSLRKVAVDRLVRDAIYADGGPSIHNGSEE